MVNKIIRQLACICVFIFGMTCVGCSPEKLVVSNVQESDDTDKKADVNSDDTESSATTGKDTDIGEDADSSESILDEAYSEREDSELAVYVCGAVKKSGVYELPSGARINDALESAGGFADDADTDAVNLADRLQDGQRIYFHMRARRLSIMEIRPLRIPMWLILGVALSISILRMYQALWSFLA